MLKTVSSQQELKFFSVWDRTTRCFHWLNVVCVLGLIGIGLVILNNKALGVSNDGKLLLKTVHAYIGYVFAVNLLWRFIWGFLGNTFARWRSVLPFGKGYLSSLRLYVAGLTSGESQPYLGHNPLGKLMVALLFLLLAIQASTGLVLAGTDLYLPPFGHEIKEWIAQSGEDHQKLTEIKAGSKDNIDPKAYADMRNFREAFSKTHVFTFYLLLLAIPVHIIGVIVAEIRDKNGLISAMFTGRKVVSGKPVDFK
ncbi:MAG: cytochrome b/b6 domain-containing protein [Gammaproteobacteria bacterium]